MGQRTREVCITHCVPSGIRLGDTYIERYHLCDECSTGVEPGLVQELVRLKLKDNRLPASRAVALREIGRFASNGRQCDACDERIGPNQKAVLVMVSREWMSGFFHC